MNSERVVILLMSAHFVFSFNNYQFYHRESVIDSKKISRRHWICFVLGVCTSHLPLQQVTAEVPNLKQIYQWNQLEFDYVSSIDRQNDINTGVFSAGSIAPIDMDVFYSKSSTTKVFITIPRFMSGVPATLGTVTNKKLNGNPIIRPYPDWHWHRRPEECRSQRIVSVFRVKIDECGRLWVLDTGKVGDNYLCPPQILAFDLNTDALVHSVELSESVVSRQHLLVTPEVDVRNPNEGCRDTFVYVADVLGFALLVHDVARNLSWRIQDKTFYPWPSYGTYSIAGDSFELMDGILGMSLLPHLPGQDRKLFYHAMSSPTENYVQTRFLRNKTMFEHDAAATPEIFKTYFGQRSTQSAAEAIDKDGIMFFGLLRDMQIACWNTNTEYTPKNFHIVASDPITLQFPSGIKVVRNKKNEQELWILTSRFQRIATDTLNAREVNFRIQAGKVDDLVFNSKCQSKFSNHVTPGGGYGLFGG